MRTRRVGPKAFGFTLDTVPLLAIVGRLGLCVGRVGRTQRQAARVWQLLCHRMQLLCNRRLDFGVLGGARLSARALVGKASDVDLFGFFADADAPVV